MARASAHKGKEKPTPKEAARSAGKSRPKTASKSPKGSSAPKAKASPVQDRPKKASAAGKRPDSAARKRAAGETPATPPLSPRGAARIQTPEVAPRLLRQTKTTSAALAHLEKGIELLFKKDIRKARSEFGALVDNYPGELEILARVRSYLQICEREETAQKKSMATPDELYALGIMEHNKGDYDRAIAYFRKSLEKHRDSDYIYYSMAASLAMKGDPAAAIENLRRAVELNEDSRVHARNDSDFSPLESHREFQKLVGLNPAQASEPE